MDTKKVLFFLGVLNRKTVGHEDEIADLYMKAFDEDDDINRLRHLLDDYIYYKEIGESLWRNGDHLKNNIFSNPSESLETILQIKQANETIEKEIMICKSLMYSPLPFSESFTVLKKQDTISFMRALRMIASMCVYLISLYSGIDAIKNLSWNAGAGIQEMLDAVNTRFLPALFRVNKPNYCWVIRKKKMGGRALFWGDGFYLSYESAKSVETLCSTINKEPIGTHAYLNIDAYESDLLDVPYCWGIGHVLSVYPDNALSLLQRGYVTKKTRVPGNDELRRKMPTPMECIKQLTDGAIYCITPDELLITMNRWQVGHEIEVRKRMHTCLFCGKHVYNGGLVCPSHIRSWL